MRRDDTLHAPARVCPMRMAADWTPPYPAWSRAFPAGTTEVVMAYFGAQAPEDRAWAGALHRALAGPSAPFRVDVGRFVDRAGVDNALTVAYWNSAATHDAWRRASEFEAWWASPQRLAGPHGYSREAMTLPFDRFETLFSSTDAAGVAAGGTAFGEPVREHAYWGGARDRIPASAYNPLASPFGETLPTRGSAVTRGRRPRVRVPENIAVIRSAQDWSACRDDERAVYRESVHPVLEEGMRFLRDHPSQVSCCDMRMVSELDARGVATQRTYGLGYFLSLGHLERWAESHPTHLAIFNAFLKMVDRFQGQLDLRLWHEVSVLPGAGQVFEYVNCHPRTGLLPWFAADAVG